MNSLNNLFMNLSWLLLPITAHAILNPATPQTVHVPLLGEESSYVQEYPINASNSLVSTGIAQGSPLSTTTLLEAYMPSDMMPILNCESHLRQWDENGHILTSSTNDVGIAQINVATWGAKAKELGYDIYTTEGNLQMAKYILDNQGKTAWVCYNNSIKR